MQPLQRSYAITEERIEEMILGGSLSSIYDEAKVNELENSEEQLSGKDQKKLENFQSNKPYYESLIAALRSAVSEKVYYSPEEFLPVLSHVLSGLSVDKKLLAKIADGLSAMDKKAKVQKDRKGNVIFDKGTKTIHWQMDSLFNKCCWDNWITTCKRIKSNSFLQYT